MSPHEVRSWVASFDLVGRAAVLEAEAQRKQPQAFLSQPRCALPLVAFEGGAIREGVVNLAVRPSVLLQYFRAERSSGADVRQVLALAGEAGFPAHLVKVRVPAREGVYAVYALTVPERRGRSVRENVMQRAIAKALFARLPEY